MGKVHFYSSLYTLDRPSIPAYLDNLVEPSISNDDSEKLIYTPDGAEIWETLKRMPSDKALGPDGMTIFFFKQF